MNTTAPKVSVIVPAYNAEKYLERCLNSIATQTMPEFECIIVNDGSTDNTSKIADSFARNDTRFRVINQENGGVAAARKTGINAALGIYTIQFDSDDWVESNILEELISEAEKVAADMVICDYYHRVTPKEDTYVSQKPICLETSIVFGLMMQQLYGCLWNKLIKRECYQKYSIHFIHGMNLSEDQYICLQLLACPIKVGYVPKALYHYDLTQNPHSAVNSGIPPAARLKPLELIAETTDITIVQEYFDRAILFIAYEGLFFSKEKCPNYVELFKKHLPSIRRAKGFPLRVKILVLLRIYGIRIPIYSIKKLFGKYKNG